VSDGSTDDTDAEARRGGATDVLTIENVGKPAALRTGFDHWQLADRYDRIVVLDDDTRLAPDFVEQATVPFADETVCAVSGETLNDFAHEQRWTWLPNMRAIAYWRYGWGVKVGQSALRAITVLPGSNTMFRTDTFGTLLARPVQYIVDDTQWLLDIQTERMGRVVHQRAAKAYVQDPALIRDYYRQFLRWMWGTFQGVRGHKIGRRLTWFSISYSFLLLDWMLYVLAWPVFLAVVGWAAYRNGSLLEFTALYFGGYLAWSIVAAIALRRWRLVLMFPGLAAFDWLNRIVFAHAFGRAMRRPTVTTCVWDSPARLATAGKGVTT
jgi:cellulose synthase/poly-beta-1,6-N-acetylglucosamine synthase-like glycosyltransferase